MKRLIHYLKLLFIRPDKSFEIVRCADGIDRLRAPTIVIEGSSVMVQSPINQEITFTDLGNNEYFCKGEHVKPRCHTDPFKCNRGVNCPWTKEMQFPIDKVRFNSREVCLKCGLVGGGSSQ